MPFTPPPPETEDPLDDDTYLALTKEGERELKEPGTTLTPSYLEALVLIDGQTSVRQILEQASSVAPGVLRATLSALVEKGLASPHPGPDSRIFAVGDFFTLDTQNDHSADLAAHDDPETDAKTETLRRNGYYVNMAHRPSIKRQHDEGHKLTVLVIDDDIDIGKLLRFYLKLEDIETRTATNREEILAEFRRTPLPDLVLLDVRLKDANGFDVLTRMRQHPVLKYLPVIMLTASATREAVLKGILAGADGYITKPFQVQPLIRAVKTVLGLKIENSGPDWDYTR